MAKFACHAFSEVAPALVSVHTEFGAFLGVGVGQSERPRYKGMEVERSQRQYKGRSSVEPRP